MGFFYFFLGLGGLLLLTLILTLKQHFERRARLPFVADETLFSPSQGLFLGVLEQAMGHGYRVFGRVRVAEVIGLQPRLDRDSRRRAYALLGDRQFDFLVCAAGTGAIVCAVNLEPRSRLGRWSTRDPLEQICAAAGLPFVRVREADDYVVAEVARRLREAIQALRPPVEKSMEPPRPAPGEAQYSLSEVAVEDEREPRLTPVHVRSGVVMPTSEVPPRPPTPPVESAPRRDPTLVMSGDLDLGPAFHIDDSLIVEDERPAWGRRS